jgi:hypothetical protein
MNGKARPWSVVKKYAEEASAGKGIVGKVLLKEQN